MPGTPRAGPASAGRRPARPGRCCPPRSSPGPPSPSCPRSMRTSRIPTGPRPGSVRAGARRRPLPRAVPRPCATRSSRPRGLPLCARHPATGVPPAPWTAARPRRPGPRRHTLPRPPARPARTARPPARVLRKPVHRDDWPAARTAPRARAPDDVPPRPGAHRCPRSPAPSRSTARAHHAVTTPVTMLVVIRAALADGGRCCVLRGPPPAVRRPLPGAPRLRHPSRGRGRAAPCGPGVRSAPIAPGHTPPRPPGR